jgi:hypothetical protein
MHEDHTSWKKKILQDKAIACSSLNDCKPTNVLFSVKGLNNDSSCIVVRKAEESSKEELQVNTPCTSSSNEKVNNSFVKQNANNFFLLGDRKFQK